MLKKQHKAVISICLAFIMMFSLIGAPAFAEGDTPPVEIQPADTADGGQSPVQGSELTPLPVQPPGDTEPLTNPDPDQPPAPEQQEPGTEGTDTATGQENTELSPAGGPMLRSSLLESSSTTVTIGDFTYTLSGGEATVIGYTGPDNVIIPGTITYEGTDYPVTGMTISVFGDSSIESVTIPGAMKSIVLSAFYNCTSLNSVVFSEPGSLESIGDFAFYGCTSLSEITIPSSVYSIDKKAFMNCSSLSAVYFFGSMPGFGTGVFDGTASDFTIYYHISQTSTGWSGFSDYNAKAFCALTLDLQDGSTPDSSYAVVDSSGHITAPPDPTGSLGSFAGWYKDAACTKAFDFSTDTVSDDITLYANWTSGGKITGTATDSSVTMAGGNTAVLDTDNSWEISVSGGTLKGASGDALPAADLDITGIPNGLTWAAQNAGANKIKITVSDTANPALTGKTSVSVVVRGSAVSEAGVSNSEPIVVCLYPAGNKRLALAINQDTNTIYVANKGSCDVSVMDGSTDTITATIGVGVYPGAISVNPDTNKVYVTNQQQASVMAINGAGNQVIATISTGSLPADFAINRNTNKIYVSNLIGNNVTVIDGNTDTASAAIATGSLPMNVELNQNTNKIYVANNGGHSVSVIDGSSDTVAATVDTVDKGTYAVAVNPVADKVYVTNQKNMTDPGSVTVISGSANTTTITVGKNPRAVAVNPNTNKIYVANLNDDTVTVIDGATDTVTDTINTGDGPLALGINKVTNIIYVANCGDNTVTIIDGATNATSSVAAGDYPCAVAVNEATNKAYIANQYSDDLTIISSLPPFPVPFKVAGTAVDSSVTMANDNKAVSSSDNTWDVKLTSGTLKGTAGADLSADILISGLPATMSYTAINGGGNDILITVAGTADTALTADVTATAVVKSSAVTETSALDSEGIALSLRYVSPAACEIVGGAQYDTLDAAIDAVPADTPTTIRLLRTINRTTTLTVEGSKKVTLDMNSYDLNINIDSPMSGYDALYVRQGGSLTTTGSGALNAIGYVGGIRALDSAVVNITGSTGAIGGYSPQYGGAKGICANGPVSVTVRGPVSGYFGVEAESGASVTVHGDVSGESYAAYAQTSGALSIDGDASGKGTEFAPCVNAHTNATIHIGGSVQATDLNGDGVEADEASTVTVSGNVNAGLKGLSASGGSTIEVGGSVTTATESGAGFAAFVEESSRIEIGGDAIAAAERGIMADTGGMIIVDGDVQGEYYGAVVSKNAEVEIGGDVRVGTTGGAGVNAYEEGKVTIDGTIQAGKDMIFGESDGAPVTPTTKAGYLTYSDGVGSYVWLKNGTAPALTVEGTATDSSVTMAGGNTAVSSDNNWEIRLTTGTLKGAAGGPLTAEDLTVTALPAGLSWTARNGGDNKIIITVAGAATSPVTNKTKVSVVVKAGAVTDIGAADSAAVSVFLYPAKSSGGGGGGGGSSATIPTVATANATSITGNSAVLNGEIKSRGGDTVTDYGFSYSSDEKQWTEVQAGTDDLLGSFSYTLSGLQPNTAYYFKAYATNGKGTSWGGEKSFIVYQEQSPLSSLSGQQMVLRFYVGETGYYVNGQLKTMDTVPVILGDRTLLPVRYVSEPLGAAVGWDETEQKVTIALNGKTIELWIGRNTAMVNGTAVPIDSGSPEVAPVLADPGRTMIPLRFVSEQLGCQVDWEPATGEVKVSYPKS